MRKIIFELSKFYDMKKNEANREAFEPCKYDFYKFLFLIALFD
jgi:hypothetical protein